MTSNALSQVAGIGLQPTERKARGEQRADERSAFGETIARALSRGRGADAASGSAAQRDVDDEGSAATRKSETAPQRDGQHAAPACEGSMPLATAVAACAAPAVNPADEAAPVDTADGSCRAGAVISMESDPTENARAGGRDGLPDALQAAAGKASPSGGKAAASGAATSRLPTDVPTASVGEAEGHGEARPAHDSDGAGAAFAAQLARAAGTADGNPAHALALGASIRGAPHAFGATAPPAVPASVSTPVGEPGFHAHLAAEVATISMAGIERAEIELRPRELGPVRIELSMSGESARIAFSAAHPDTRQAIEQSMPILKDMLAERGLMLADASVSDGRAGADSSQPEGAEARVPTGAAAAPEGGVTDEALAGRHMGLRRSLLDVYA